MVPVGFLEQISERNMASHSSFLLCSAKDKKAPCTHLTIVPIFPAKKHHSDCMGILVFSCGCLSSVPPVSIPIDLILISVTTINEHNNSEVLATAQPFYQTYVEAKVEAKAHFSSEAFSEGMGHELLFGGELGTTKYRTRPQ